MVLVGEAHLRREDYLDKLKIALVTHNPNNLLKMYPNIRPAVETTEEVTEKDIEESEGTWKFKDEAFDPKSAEKLLTEMLAKNTGRLSMSDIGEGWM